MSAESLSGPHSLIAAGTGLMLVFVLYGQAFQEAYNYYRGYPNDGYALKSIIAALMASNTLHAIVIIHIFYKTVITEPFNDTTAILHELWSFRLLVMVVTLTESMVFLFFARRVYKLCHPSKWFLPLVAASYLSVYALVISLTILRFVDNSPPHPKLNTHAVITFGQIMGVVGGLSLTARLVWYLHTHRTGFKRTDNLINSLILYAVNTGICTVLLQVVAAVLLLSTSGLTYYPISCVTPSIHTSCVLAAVNSRRALIDHGSGGLELKSFNMDVAPDRESSIQWARSVGENGERPRDIGAGTEHRVRLSLAASLEGVAKTQGATQTSGELA
ncbi:hypothetical protein C8Q76DRAFT_851918 [Earliella scabrosa]|nr:hypothetical protein C8Q76DRAFT_851918 [Earliella scabrosa]